MADPSTDCRSILFVRHGGRRGPQIRLRPFRPAYFDPFLRDLATFDPELRQRVGTWDTGDVEPDLSGVVAVFFLLHDPLAQQYHECFAEAAQLAERADREGIRVVNPPPALSRSKSAQATLWLEAGVRTPEPHRFSDRAELLELAERSEFPVLLKHDLLHAQWEMRKIDSIQQLRQEIDEHLPYPGFLSSFVDVRQGYRRIEPASPYARYFHKKRALIFGQHVTTNHLFFSSSPIVGFKTSTFSSGRSFNPLRRWWGLRGRREHLRLDYEYWEQETERETELLEAARVLDLEFAAIDYSSLADGSCILWEANPHFALHLWPLGIYTRRRRLRQRFNRQHRVLARFLRDLLQS